MALSSEKAEANVRFVGYGVFGVVGVLGVLGVVDLEGDPSASRIAAIMFDNVLSNMFMICALMNGCRDGGDCCDSSVSTCLVLGSVLRLRRGSSG